jgi:hypothetical protein
MIQVGSTGIEENEEEEDNGNCDVPLLFRGQSLMELSPS